MMVQRENPDFNTSAYCRYLRNYTHFPSATIHAGQKEEFFREDISPGAIRNLARGSCVYTVIDTEFSVFLNSEKDPLGKIIIEFEKGQSTHPIRGR